MWYLVQVIGLSSYIHDANSRASNRKFANLFDAVVDQLDTPPIANQPFAVSNAMVNSGFPLELVVCPTALVEEHVHLRLRLHAYAQVCGVSVVTGSSLDNQNHKE